MVNSPPRKIVSVVFWKEINEKEPVREWLKTLTKSQKKIIGEDVKTVEMGWPLGMPLVKSMGKGIWEVRSNFKNGIARILFKMHKNQMVLLHGFIKKSQKTPLKDLETALKRAKQLEEL
ncbi:MAG: type II toxin-antitoxin system RelE/ParE family toxin [Parachlamydiales bacterium]|nr:type II toxin-antitoxin system RelE/ParE family toxin [Parachlamydiales bacterium]